MDKPPLFTAEEISCFRADIAERRVPGSFEPGRWSVSPLNRDPRIVRAMPSAVRLRDSTLRSLETMAGVVPGPARLALLRALVRAGVPEVVGAGAAGRSSVDLRAEVDTVKQENPACRISCPLVVSPDDVARAAAAGYDGVQVWVQGFGAASQVYRRVHDLAWAGQDWRTTMPVQSRDQVLAAASWLVDLARERGLRVSTPLLMVSYLTDDVLEQTVPALVAAGASELTLFDGPGALGPEAFALLVARVRELAPEVEIGLHPHNTFGLAVGCAVAAARAGATVVEVSVNGYCGGAGNADLAATAAAFEALYGVPTGIRLGDLTDLARAAARLTGQHLARNHPVTGEHAFDWGGLDIITQEGTVDPLLHNCLEPTIVGNRRHLPVTAVSGPYTLADKLSELGVDATAEQVLTVLHAVRDAMASGSGRLTDDDILGLARTVLAAG